MPSRDPSQYEKFRFYACSPPLCASIRSPLLLSQRKTMFRCFLSADPNRTSSETLIPLRRSSSKSWSRSPRLSRSLKPFSGQIVKHGRQFAWHVDHDAVTAAHFHDLPSGDAFIFLCEETKGTRIPIIGKDEDSPLDCLGSARKQDRHFKGSKRLRHTAPVYPIPPFGSYVEHFGREWRHHAGMLFQRHSTNALQKLSCHLGRQSLW